MEFDVTSIKINTGIDDSEFKLWKNKSVSEIY